MPKIKTHSGAKKRFKLSKNGKPMRGHAFNPHLKQKEHQAQEKFFARFRLRTRPTPLRSKSLFPTNNIGGIYKWHE